MYVYIIQGVHCDCVTVEVWGVVLPAEEVVAMMSSSPRLERSCSNHFLVVPSSLSTDEKVESFSWTGRHCLRASRALEQSPAVSNCTEDRGSLVWMDVPGVV